jgi:hypothetical protein
MNKNILYEDLNNNDKEVINKHLMLAGGLKMWERITNHLIDEFHNKKRIITNICKNKIKYIIPDMIANQYYHRYLFKNQKGITNLDIFPSEFSCRLETILEHELSLEARTHLEFTNIYYFRDISLPKELKYEDYDKELWILDDEYEMTDHDITIMEKYKMSLFEFIDNCLTVIDKNKDFILKKYYNNMIKERKRFESCMIIDKAIN